MGGNLFWGNHSRYFGDKISLNGRPSPISLILHQNNAKHYRHYFDCRGFATNLKKLVIARFGNAKSKQSKQNTIRTKCESLQKFLLRLAFAKSRISLLSRHCEANHRFAEAIHENSKIDCHDFATQNLVMTSGGDSSLRGRIVDSHEAIQTNQSHEAQTESRPIRGAKNRIQGHSSASADFLLESELRGTPPKSEKRQLLARRGSGAGGAALLRKENCNKDLIDSKADLSAESRYKIVSKVNFSKVTIQ